MTLRNNISFILILFFITASACQSIKKTAINQPEKLIHGYTAPGFENVKQVFTENFIKRNEKGAAICVYYKDTIVVDLYGGYKNKKKDKWDKETLVLLFSATKGITALTTALAVSDGIFQYNDNISKYWPEFGINGKEHISVENMLSHQAGLPLFDKKVKIKDINDSVYMNRILINQKPLWNPGLKQGYHLYSTGLYLNELFIHADFHKRNLNEYFNERIAIPENIEFYFGLPDSISRNRVAHIIHLTSFRKIYKFIQLPRTMRLKLYNPFSLINKTFRILIGFNPNKENFLKTRIPSVNGVGKVSDVAKLYWIFSKGAPELQLNENVFNYIKDEPHIFPDDNCDEVLNIPMYYKAGFRKPGNNFNFGTNYSAFGMSGAGGSFAFADPEINLGYCYAPRLMKGFAQNDPREKALRDAVYDCIKKLELHTSP